MSIEEGSKKNEKMSLMLKLLTAQPGDMVKM